MGGAGGAGSEIGEALVRKGVGTLVIFDHDLVEPTNLIRQHFYERDLFKNKALRLAKNLAREGVLGTVIQGYPLRLEEAIEAGIDLSGSVAIVAVDANQARIAASRFFRSKGMPVVFTAVSETANNGYVFVQEAAPNAPCFACLFPDAVHNATDPCPGTPAIKDILKVVAGIVVYAVDTLLPGMARPRGWHYKEIFLDGSIPGRDWMVARRQDCALCGSQQEIQGAARP
jgi:molybdopterin/thiamine biosynthesis adenylyltransferase